MPEHKWTDSVYRDMHESDECERDILASSEEIMEVAGLCLVELAKLVDKRDQSRRKNNKGRYFDIPTTRMEKALEVAIINLQTVTQEATPYVLRSIKYRLGYQLGQNLRESDETLLREKFTDGSYSREWLNKKIRGEE